MTGRALILTATLVTSSAGADQKPSCIGVDEQLESTVIAPGKALAQRVLPSAALTATTLPPAAWPKAVAK